jgi:hypothetical protein
MYSHFISFNEIQLFIFELNKITLIMKSALYCLERITKHWVTDSFGLLGHAE